MLWAQCSPASKSCCLLGNEKGMCCSHGDGLGAAHSAGSGLCVSPGAEPGPRPGVRSCSCERCGAVLAPCIKRINWALVFPSGEFHPQSLVASIEDFFAALHKKSSVLASQSAIREFLLAIPSGEWMGISEKQETVCAGSLHLSNPFWCLQGENENYVEALTGQLALDPPRKKLLIW